MRWQAQGVVTEELGSEPGYLSPDSVTNYERFPGKAKQENKFWNYLEGNKNYSKTELQFSSLEVLVFVE